jgi:Flp pilus assembly pilin Flp
MFESVKLIRAIWSDRRGVTAMEYGSIAAGVGVVLAASIVTFGSDITGAFTRAELALTSAGTAG